MKKLLAFAAVAALVSAAFADGLKVTGDIKAGLTADPDAKTVVANKDAVFLQGNNFGEGARTRINFDYSKDNAGLKARFQSQPTSADFFAEKTIKYAIGYGKAFDGMLEFQGGKLWDFETATDGYDGDAIGMDVALGNGLRALVRPVEGLTIAATASDLYAEKNAAGDTKLNEKLFGLTAKYGNDLFSVAGGYHLAKNAYAGLFAAPVEGLSLSAEVYYDVTADADDKDNTALVFWAEYATDKFSVGTDVYWWIADDAYYAAEDDLNGYINPYCSYNVTDAITAMLDATYYVAKEGDSYFTVTPEATIALSGKAKVSLYGTISSDTDVEPHTAGAGFKYAF